jgi:hypothetical protein
LVEHLVYTEVAGGSSPSPPTLWIYIIDFQVSDVEHWGVTSITVIWSDDRERRGFAINDIAAEVVRAAIAQLQITPVQRFEIDDDTIQG